MSTHAPGQTPHVNKQYPCIQGSLHLPQPACCSQVYCPGGGGSSTQFMGLPPAPDEMPPCPPAPPAPVLVLVDAPPDPLLDPVDASPPTPPVDSPPDEPVDWPCDSSSVSAPHAASAAATNTPDIAKILDIMRISFTADKRDRSTIPDLYHGTRRRCCVFLSN